MWCYVTSQTLVVSMTTRLFYKQFTNVHVELIVDNNF